MVLAQMPVIPMVGGSGRSQDISACAQCISVWWLNSLGMPSDLVLLTSAQFTVRKEEYVAGCAHYLFLYLNAVFVLLLKN